MKRTDYILRLAIGAVFAFGVAACSEDPTSAGAGQAIAISTNRSVTVQDAGNSFTVVAWASDATGTRIAAPIAVTASSNLVTVDSAIYHPELAETRIFATANSVGVDNYLVLTAGGLTDSVTVNIMNGPFPGTVATAAAAGGTAITFTNPTPIFDEDTEASLNTADAGYVVSVTPTTLTFLLPYGTPAGPIDYTITNAGPNDFNLGGTFNLATAVPDDDSYEPNDSPATSSNALTIGTDLFGSLSDSDADDFYTVVIPTAGDYSFSVDWNDGADIDMYLLNSAGTLNACADDFLGCSTATGANPEAKTVTLQPGTYRLYLNLYASDGVTTYRLQVNQQ